MPFYARIARDAGVPMDAPDHHPGVVCGRIENGRFIAPAGASLPLESVLFLPPVRPSKIVCVGRNYAEHARELGNEVPAEPLLFLKPPSSLNAHRAPVVFPRGAQTLSYEGELGLVIGRRARRVAAAAAWDVIAGFTVLNDITARDWQKKDGQWTRAKGADTFCPVGPCWVPKETVRFEDLRIVTRVNGVVKQDASVTGMIFGVPQLIEYITAFLTLEPGDLIATGTPPGVGALEPGDVVEVEIAGIGTLQNRIERETA
ncbi:MAG: fumarylacetoacetate hydrolase family protein [Bryobacteraceae bacterium]|nr:fumarylacetoacetate hydrolase family protein [Bryobacteraceae bacterium]